MTYQSSQNLYDRVSVVPVTSDFEWKCDHHITTMLLIGFLFVFFSASIRTRTVPERRMLRLLVQLLLVYHYTIITRCIFLHYGGGDIGFYI